VSKRLVIETQKGAISYLITGVKKIFSTANWFWPQGNVGNSLLFIMDRSTSHAISTYQIFIKDT